MKKYLLKFNMVVMLFMCAFVLFAGCAPSRQVTIIQYTHNTVDIHQLYALFMEENPDGTFAEFLQMLDITHTDVELAAARGIQSVVSVNAVFTRRVVSAGQSRLFASNGAGVIYRIQDGNVYIITNYHVIFNRDSVVRHSDRITVFTFGNEERERAVDAEFMGGKMDGDIAILRAREDDFFGEIMEAAIADSDNVRLGQTAVAIGNPLARGLAVTNGIVSMLSETITMEALDSAARRMTMQAIRIDTPINSGNSGGGLFNARGELIGIVNARAVSEEGDIENIGYAIHSNTALMIAREIIGERVNLYYVSRQSLTFF